MITSPATAAPRRLRTSLRVSLRAALSAAAMAVAAGCEAGGTAAEQEYVPIVSFDTARARIITAADTFHVSVEVAEREDQRSYGLMERTSLAEDAGMIFLYNAQQPADAGFWMYRTRIPLDIAFLDDDGSILAIVAMDPCLDLDPRGCRTYPPGVPYFSALEVNRGYLAQRGIGVGDRVILDR
jgi:uncharacterized protein